MNDPASELRESFESALDLDALDRLDDETVEQLLAIFDRDDEEGGDA